MLYFVVALIIAIIIVFTIFIERALRRQDYVATVLFIVLFLCCMVIFADGFNKKDDEPIVIENVKEIHQIDTVTVISGKDTTRTYSITFSR